jgi:hypothetical protein
MPMPPLVKSSVGAAACVCVCVCMCGKGATQHGGGGEGSACRIVGYSRGSEGGGGGGNCCVSPLVVQRQKETQAKTRG